MQYVDSKSFHETANKVQLIICLFENGTDVHIDGSIEMVLSNLATELSATLIRVDHQQASDLAPLFGIKDQWPTLLIMREKIVLFCEPIKNRSSASLLATIRQAANLDMQKVRKKLQQEHEAISHLFARRVYPTAKRHSL